MKKVADYRKLLGVDKTVALKELKTIYRDFMKECHPDKFSEEEEKKAAEEKSKDIIEAYHFLVSVSPETVAENLPDYTNTITTSAIVDIAYESQVLKISFENGSSYEYFVVPKTMYIKFMNSDSKGRFARRHIFHEFLYRNVAKAIPVEA